MTPFLTLNHLQSLPTLSIRMLQWRGAGVAGIFAQRGVLTTLMVSLPGFIFSSLVLSNNRRDPLSLKEQTNSSSWLHGHRANVHHCEVLSPKSAYLELGPVTWGSSLAPSAPARFSPTSSFAGTLSGKHWKGGERSSGKESKELVRENLFD